LLPFEIRRVNRLAALGGVLLSLTIVTAANAASATPLRASFAERTYFVACPAGVPASAMCFLGQGSGEILPGGPAPETFTGYIDAAQADPRTGCAPDHSAIAIAMHSGTLYLVGDGTSCQTGPTTAVDNEIFQAVGGTGVFEGATGRGTITGPATFNANGTVSSTSTYSGELSLKGGS
jgi:hypothetical protein